MKRRSIAGLTIGAFSLGQVSLEAQAPAPRQPFFEDRPIPRAVPVTPRGVVPAPATPIPRAIPITPRPAAPPAPEAAPAPATPRPMAPPEPADPGEIRVSPNAAPKSADQVQMELADSYYARKMYAEAAPEYERYIGLYQTGPDRPAALFRLGECYRNRGTFNAAKNAYETLLSQFVNGDFVGPASYRLAEIYYQEKQYRDALTLYRKASVRLKEPAVVNAAKFFSGRCLEVLGQRLEARTVYEDLVASSKDNPFHDASRLSFALLLKDGQRLSEALKQIQLLAKDTDNPELKLEATVRSGMWSLELDPPQTARAETDFKAALAMPGKGYWKELAQLGQVRIQSDAGKHEQVLDAYEKLGSQLSPDVKPEMLMLAANAQRQLGKLPESLATYELVTKEFPGSVYDKEAQYERLRSMYQTSDEKLVAEIDKYLLANPEATKRDEVLLMKAEVLFKKDDFAGAIPIYSTLELSRTLTPNRKAEALFRLGWCQIQAQNLEGAIKSFTSFVSLYPTHKLLPFALLQRGLAHQSLKNLTAALRDYETLVKSHPKSPQREMALQQQALIQGQQGNYAAMGESFKQLLKEFPETPAKGQASYWIGWSAFETKNYKEAVPYLRDAREFEAAKKGDEDKEQFGEKAAIRVLLCQYYLEDVAETAKEVDRYSKEGKTKVPPEILRWLGRKYYEGATHDKAEKYLVMLTERDDAMPDDFLLLGLSQLAQSKYQESAATLEAYLKPTKLPVPRANGLLSLAKAQIGMTAFDNAQKSVDETLSLQPEGEISGRARIVAGDILMARKRPEDAAKLYESVAVMLDDPEITPEALEQAVKAWRAAGKDDEAAKTLNKLKSRYPEYWQRKSAPATP